MPDRVRDHNGSAALLGADSANEEDSSGLAADMLRQEKESRQTSTSKNNGKSEGNRERKEGTF